MLYYGEYLNGRRYVRAYDEEKHGTPRIVGDAAFLYHNAICGSAAGIFSTEEDVLASWGKYSNKPVIMPDGREVTPAQYFGNDTADDVFIPWSMVRGGVMAGRVLNRHKRHYKASHALLMAGWYTDIGRQKKSP